MRPRSGDLHEVIDFFGLFGSRFSFFFRFPSLALDAADTAPSPVSKAFNSLAWVRLNADRSSSCRIMTRIWCSVIAACGDSESSVRLTCNVIARYDLFFNEYF